MNFFSTEILRQKSLEEERSVKSELKRTLSAYHLVFYGIATMTGAGLYVVTGAIVRDMAGPAASFSYLLCTIAVVFTGLCFVEFATLLPRAGSCYTYTYVVMGELPAFVIGWALIAMLVMTVTVTAKALSGTINVLTGNAISNFSSTSIGTLIKTENGTINHGILDTYPDILAVGLLLLAAIVTLSGSNISMSFNVIVSSLQMLLLTMIGVCCFVYGDIAHWGKLQGGFLPYGFGGIILGASNAIFAFAGFETITISAEESKNPRRDIPLGFFCSLGITLTLDVFAALGISYLVSRKDIDANAPFVTGFEMVGEDWMKWISVIGTIAATGSTLIAATFCMPRVIYALANDRLIFKTLAYVQPTTGVPVVSLGFGTVCCVLICLVISIEALVGVISFFTLWTYYIVGADLMLLRYSHNTAKEEYKLRISNNISASTLQCMFIVSLITYLLSCLAFSVVLDFLITFNTWFSWLAFAITVAIMSFSFIILATYQPKSITDCYQTPFMPVAPLFTILFTTILLVKVSPKYWLIAALWTLLGLVIYATYGIRNSTAVIKSTEYIRLTENSETKNSLQEKQSISSKCKN